MKKNRDVLIILLVLGLGLWALPFIAKTAFSQQEINESYWVNATVNVTNAAPQVFDVKLPPVIDLNAYSNTTVQCNVTTYDYNNDTIRLNASLFYNTQSPIGAVDQNYRYLNTSCSNVSGIQDYQINWTCTFSVNYFANNGTWYCNATAIDENDAILTNQSGASEINPLIAIKMSEVLDYGDYEAGAETDMATANITSAGNRDMNISVEGWGNAEDDGLAFVCEYGSSIPIGNEAWGLTTPLPFSFMTALTNNPDEIEAFTVPQRTSETEEVINTTYWKVQIPMTAIGYCQGKIRFTAVDKGN